MMRSFDGVGLDDLARLVGKQIDRVCGVMPKQVIGPAAWLALGIDILAAEKIGLHIHLLDIEFARSDLVVHVLMRWIKSAGMSDHAGQSGFFLLVYHRLAVRKAIGQRNLHLYVLARIHAGDRLLRVHLSWRAKNDGIHIVAVQGITQFS